MTVPLSTGVTVPVSTGSGLRVSGGVPTTWVVFPSSWTARGSSPDVQLTVNPNVTPRMRNLRFTFAPYAWVDVVRRYRGRVRGRRTIFVRYAGHQECRIVKQDSLPPG